MQKNIDYSFDRLDENTIFVEPEKINTYVSPALCEGNEIQLSKRFA